MAINPKSKIQNPKSEHIFFLGIGGIGVSALAQVALARESRVSGSDTNTDPQSNPAISRLLAGGAAIFTGHSRENLHPDVTLVVASAAISDNNPEIQEAHRHGIKVVSRAEYLGDLMAAHNGVRIAVSGTHGKTTTTAMIGVMLQNAGLDPTVFVGGEVDQLGGNIRIGSETGPFVAEACEAYDSFLYLKPDIAVITNIEADHLDHYHTFERVLDSFRSFMRNVPKQSGRIIINADDKSSVEIYRELLDEYAFKSFSCRVGTSEKCDSPIEEKEAPVPSLLGTGGLFAANITLENGSRFDLVTPVGSITCRLKVPGMHNISNSLAAAAVGIELNIPLADIRDGLQLFKGATRRQEILGEIECGNGESIVVMDDYAHHPTEIEATLSALRHAYPKRRIVAIFQPHLYSRTRDFLAQFAATLSKADVLVVTDVYAARELPIEGVRAADIVNLAIQKNSAVSAVYLPDRHDIPQMLKVMIRPNDLAVFLGAGDIREQGEEFVRELKNWRLEVKDEG